MKNIIIALLSITVYILTINLVNSQVDLRASNELNEDLSTICKKTHEKCLKYILISLKQNDIIDRFQSSRNAKLKNKELIKLTSELE